MNNPNPAYVLNALLCDVLQSAIMLLHLLSSAADNRRKHQVAPGVTNVYPQQLSSLSLCVVPAITNVPDDDLYGPSGAAAQMAYWGWLIDTYTRWEYHNRKELKASFQVDDAIPPLWDAFGDLKLIRHDILHERGIATEKNTGKCTVLRWFSAGNQMVFSTRHVFDFLNQTGVLSLGSAQHHTASHACRLSVLRDKKVLLRWRLEPKFISVYTQGAENPETDRYKRLTVVFDNGLFANVALGPVSTDRVKDLGVARIKMDGNILVFEDGTAVTARPIYEGIVEGYCDPSRKDGHPQLAVTGPPIKFR